MSPGVRIHLDPGGMLDLVALPPDELRVLLVILALAPDGELLGAERRLARLAGLSGPRELRLVLARLAARRGPDDRAWLGRDLLRGVVRIQLRLPERMAVCHPLGGIRPDAAAASARRVAPARSEADIRDAAAAAVRAVHPLVADLADAWVAKLASLDPTGSLPISIEVRSRITIERLLADCGPEAVEVALLSGLRNVRTLERGPERYLEAAARGAAATPGRRVVPGAVPPDLDEGF